MFPSIYLDIGFEACYLLNLPSLLTLSFVIFHFDSPKMYFLSYTFVTQIEILLWLKVANKGVSDISFIMAL